MRFLKLRYSSIVNLAFFEQQRSQQYRYDVGEERIKIDIGQPAQTNLSRGVRARLRVTMYPRDAEAIAFSLHVLRGATR